MDFIRYDETSGIISLDYSLKITKESGLERLNLLNSFLSEFTQPGKIKLLADFREISFDSEETHLELSKLSRNMFFEYNERETLYLAVLHKTYNSRVSQFEHWFTDKEKALNWLTQI